ncbi:hypothetical protein Fmac_006118 [Flemingia macrophylla]|uniref:Uncharacterized protein n=1 Tax=Flemingia macrophylla TaxID=520843 RepID=A0ABD1N9P8_9FABA
MTSLPNELCIATNATTTTHTRAVRAYYCGAGLAHTEGIFQNLEGVRRRSCSGGAMSLRRKSLQREASKRSSQLRLLMQLSQKTKP